MQTHIPQHFQGIAGCHVAQDPDAQPRAREGVPRDEGLWHVQLRQPAKIPDLILRQQRFGLFSSPTPADWRRSSHFVNVAAGRRINFVAQLESKNASTCDLWRD